MTNTFGRHDAGGVGGRRSGPGRAQAASRPRLRFDFSAEAPRNYDDAMAATPQLPVAARLAILGLVFVGSAGVTMAGVVALAHALLR